MQNEELKRKAEFWAKKHLESNSGVLRVWCLPSPPDDNEIRLLELNAYESIKKRRQKVIRDRLKQLKELTGVAIAQFFEVIDPSEMNDERGYQELEIFSVRIDRGTENEHLLSVLDIDLTQLNRLGSGSLLLPNKWSMSPEWSLP